MENKAFFSRLTFFNVSEQDYGNYTCVASNQLGNTNASMILYGERGRGRGPGKGTASRSDRRCARPAVGSQGFGGDLGFLLIFSSPVHGLEAHNLGFVCATA